MRSSILPLGALALVSLLLAPDRALARHIPSNHFGLIFDLAVRNENKDDLNDLSFVPVDDVEVVSTEGSESARRFTVKDYARTGPGFYRRMMGTGRLAHFGSHARYVFVLLYEPAGKNMLPYIAEDGDMRRNQKWVADWEDNLKGELTFEEGMFTIVSVYEYGNDNDNEVRDRLRYLFDATRDIMREYYPAVNDAHKKRYEQDLEKTPVTFVDNADLIAILDSDLWEHKSENDQAEVGYFGFLRQEKMHMEVINNGDEIIFAQWFPMGSREQAQDLVLEGAAAYIADNHLKDGQMLAIRDPEDSATLSVRAVLPLAAGEYEGRQIRRAYDEFRNDYGKKLHEEMNQLVEDTAEGLWEAIKDEKPTYLSKDDLFYLVDTMDLTEFAGESAAAEGFFEFVLGDGEVSLEVTNTGNEVTFAIWWNLPDDVTSDQKTRIVDKSNREVGGKILKHFGPAAVSMYPGFDQVLRAAVTIPIDGSVANRQIREAFDHFAEEFCHEVDKKVRKVIDKET